MKRPVRSPLVAVALVAAGSVLGGCGGPTPYCATVQEQTSTLETFGEERTNAAYTTYADTLDALAQDAPESVAAQWTELSEVTRGVLAAQEEVGLALEEMGDDAKVAELSTEQLAGLNEAYEAFNATEEQRSAVVENVEQECDVDLEEEPDQ